MTAAALLPDPDDSPLAVPPLSIHDDADAPAGGEPLVHVAPVPHLSAGQLLFRTLGAAEVHVGPDLLIGPASERMFSLLVVCAMSAEHVVTRRRLRELVWPDMDETGARHSLRQHAYRLRQHGVHARRHARHARARPFGARAELRPGPHAGTVRPGRAAGSGTVRPPVRRLGAVTAGDA